MEKEHFTFGEKAIISIDEILAIKNGESVGFIVKGLPFKRNNLKFHSNILDFVPDDECKQLTKAFFSSPYLYNRQGLFCLIAHV